MVHEFIAENLAHDRAGAKKLRALLETSRQGRRMRLVGVARGRKKFQTVFDPIETGGDACRNRQVRVGVGGREAVFDPDAFGAGGDGAQGSANRQEGG